MVLETQSIKTSPSFEEANGVCASHTRNGSADRRSYFLGEVTQPYQAEPDVELNLSVGDHAIVPKIEKIQESELSNFNSKIQVLDSLRIPLKKRKWNKLWNAYKLK
ncbi:SH3 domain-containing protein 2 isoform X1 [Eucalyptus grandis]|uniref:SH3 domain-containing protein 2 isoform X1 n=1 Tax=Eucalyptus grandis TaxID=71139 RepID=UPI00192E8B8B|nr:SH3 domain-containing protein 2 isoform X1 [Eucalyptus grandis]XP_039157510.1 SH3 domain-containing protein 2 isoform X1 [Eucalyptus grandis]